MATKKGSRAVYNSFFEKFKRKSGYIGSLLKNASGTSVFEFEFDSKSDTDEAKEYLTKNSVKYTTNSINSKKVMVKP
jgi:hypothetical protein